MSWARLGAQVTGVDFSQNAVDLARSLSEELGIDARSICSDIYDLRDKLTGQDIEALRARGRIIGTAEQIADQLRALSAAGLARVMLRWENLDDPAGLRAFGAALLPLLK